jgi:hypothetical protein
MNAPAAPTTAGLLLLLGLQGLLAVWVGIECFALGEWHIEPAGFIAGFQLGTASRDEEEGNYDETPVHELLCSQTIRMIPSPLKR